ncbi:hypothetical protein [Vulcanisaeta souniana]|uniref:LTD domain-containing protein n=1 Tax=Vulcanisaeta souniana JCM 11219 TaxID=1293586 RepID=A0A830EK57_9CREN|nr:hypothetical protein [Vulcanisaeta souniana]BDR91295.1 hypothetical protein Vsou_03880 [Vulcanisaeta souniana JCM 11219]GGI84781.1 hypothetical protein GCM10007112_22190 [Vulcanisaeta souniana JCM 11219]
MNCSVYLDRRVFSSGEPIYITLINLGNTPINIGSWQVIDANGRIVYSIEPPQIMISPSSSFVVVWFQFDNDGKPVSRGRYRVVWRPVANGNVLECLSDFFEVS